MLGRNEVLALENELENMAGEWSDEHQGRLKAESDAAKAWREVGRLDGKLHEAVQELAERRADVDRLDKVLTRTQNENARLKQHLNVALNARKSKPKSRLRPSAWPDSAKAAFVWAWFVLGVLALVAGIVGVALLAGGLMFAEHQDTAAALRGIGFAAVYSAVTCILFKRYG